MKLPPHHTFANPALGELAFTHRSFAARHNERLEWLGDAVLQFEVSRLLYRRFPHMAEGSLSQVRTRLVERGMLARVARDLRLGEFVRLGAAGMHAGRDNENLLANLTEAYLAAVYLDGGDVQALIANWMSEEVEALAAQVQALGIRSLRDAKTRLQEHMQKRGQARPKYTLQQQQGKDGMAVFVVECRVDDATCAEGKGATRAKAEEQAADACLRQLGEAAK